MHVDAPFDAVREAYEGVVAEYRKRGRIPGFRKGKAPVEVVESRYGDAILDDTRDVALPDLYRDALKQEGIVPVAIVGVRDVTLDKAAGIAFKVLIDVAPEFKLPKYRKIGLKAMKVDVKDEQVDEQVDQLRERYARFEDVEGRPVQRGDLVRVDFTAACDGTPVKDLAEDAAPFGEAADFWVLAEDSGFVPGFADGLDGLSAGEEKDFDIQFPADFRVAALAGKQATYHVAVKGLRERVLPQVDEAFLKQLNVETADALKDRIRKELSAAAEARRTADLRDQAARFLLDKTEFDLPQSVVEQETKLAVRSIVQRSAMQGATQEQLEEQKEDILNAATHTSTERVKLGYILSRIADEEGLEVSDDEVEKRIEEMAAGYGMPPEQFRSELEKRNGVEHLSSDIRAEKTLALLVEIAKVK
jgi:trigger factor